MADRARDYEHGALTYTIDESSFGISFKHAQRQPTSWKEEILAAAKRLANVAGNKPIWLCFSGGIDSEIMCEAFFQQGIHFSVLTLQHAGGTNEHDVRYARKWCAEHGIVHNIIPIDMQKFLKEDVAEYAEHYIAEHPFRYVHIRLLETVENMGGYAVLGAGEQLFYSHTDSDGSNALYLTIRPGMSSVLEWCRHNNTNHEPYFYFSTPELCLAYQQLPLVDFAYTHPEIFSHSSNPYLFTRLVSHTVWDQIESRNKYNGFEKIEAHTRKTVEFLRKKFGSRIERYPLSIRDMREQLSVVQ